MTGVKKTQGEKPQEIIVPEKKRDKRINLPTYDEINKVRGIFKNLEFPSTGISIPFRAGWKGPIKQFTFFDGCEYVVPETLAKHLNENCAYKTYKWVSTDGKEVMNALPVSTASMPNFRQEIDKKVSRFLFQVLGPA